MSSGKAWWGFDVDKTIAVDHGGTRGGVIGEPIKPLIRRMKYYLRTGRKVAIVTARVHPSEPDAAEQYATVRSFLKRNFTPAEGDAIDIRSDKDRHMIELFDDRAAQVIPNKGILVREELRRAVAALAKIAYSFPGPTPQGVMAAEAFCSLDPWSRDLANTVK